MKIAKIIKHLQETKKVKLNNEENKTRKQAKIII